MMFPTANVVVAMVPPPVVNSISIEPLMASIVILPHVMLTA